MSRSALRQPARPRLLLVSVAVPPAPSGQARVLGHLLAGATPADCLMLSGVPPQPALLACEPSPGGILQLAPRPHAPAPHRPWRRWPWLGNQATLALSAWRRGREIAAAGRRFGAEVVVGCTADPLDLPASALAAALLRRPFVAYLFDDPVYQWPPGEFRCFAARAEALWTRRLAAAIAPNAFMARDFAARTGHEARIVRNPAAAGAFAAAAPVAHEGSLRVVYTGSVYHAQADAFTNLLRALDGQAGRAILELHTSQTAAEVAKLGVAGPHVRVRPHVTQEESYRVQRGADALFLPLAFASPIPEVIRSSAPAKLAEYLASGRPILAHAPPGSFVAEHLRETDAAFIVDRPDPGALAAALSAIRLGGEAVARRVGNARHLAGLYRADTAREAFWGVLSDVVGRNRSRTA